jgi:4a-hydroxytetrahydrobiopterin dehydratase
MASRPAILPDEEIARRLELLPDWMLRDGKLYREFRFTSFAEAFGFMASVAIVAQELDHHPDWTNSYDRVAVSLNSHDVGGISERDFTLAERMEKLFTRR